MLEFLRQHVLALQQIAFIAQQSLFAQKGGRNSALIAAYLSFHNVSRDTSRMWERRDSCSVACRMVIALPQPGCVGLKDQLSRLGLVAPCAHQRIRPCALFGPMSRTKSEMRGGCESMRQGSLFDLAIPIFLFTSDQ